MYRVQGELPRWSVAPPGAVWRAELATYATSGIVVEASDPDELISRVRAVERAMHIGQYPEKEAALVAFLRGRGWVMIQEVAEFLARSRWSRAAAQKWLVELCAFGTIERIRTQGGAIPAYAYRLVGDPTRGPNYAEEPPRRLTAAERSAARDAERAELRRQAAREREETFEQAVSDRETAGLAVRERRRRRLLAATYKQLPAEFTSADAAKFLSCAVLSATQCLRDLVATGEFERVDRLTYRRAKRGGA